MDGQTNAHGAYIFGLFAFSAKGDPPLQNLGVRGLRATSVLRVPSIGYFDVAHSKSGFARNAFHREFEKGAKVICGTAR